jgi:alpha-L-fucosidase
MDRRNFLKTCGVGAPLVLLPGMTRAANGEGALVKPSAEALAWADSEIGVLIHNDILVFEPGYQWRRQWGYHPDPAIFNPTQLDTDQWIEAAKDLGAKYAVLVAKHCTGFSLWPTAAHNYSVKSAPWKNGQGDIVADFVASCRKYGVKPGFYYSSAANAYYQVNNPGRVRSGDPEAQKRYNQVVVQQLTELWSKYGELFEIWFDGGALPPERGGPDLIPLLDLQPNAVYFQGPAQAKNLIRWSGNERGVAPDPNWSTTNATTNAAGDIEIKNLHGDPEGKIWCPAEADVPIRKRASFAQGWFWKAGQDSSLWSLDQLEEKYLLSVGRNANLMLGMVIDNRGLVPDADRRLMKAFGEKIRRRFAAPIAETSGRGVSFELDLGKDHRPGDLVIMEDISQGQRIRKYSVQGNNGLFWAPLFRGSSVGHKRIHRGLNRLICRVRLHIEESNGAPVIKHFGVY